jgi:hypothetical protein
LSSSLPQTPLPSWFVLSAAAVDLRTGWGVFNRDLGLEAQGSASFAVGAEVDLD